MARNRFVHLATIGGLVLGACAMVVGTTSLAKGKPGPEPPAPTYPVARYWHYVTSNGSPSPESARVYMFGGNGGLPGTPYLNDLWYYRVDSGVWTGLRPSSRKSPQIGRGNGSLSCGDGKCVVFAGTTGTKYLNETWYFSEPAAAATSVSWAQVACKTPGSCPSARYLPATAFDPTRHYHVTFGGYDDPSGALGDTWTFGGTSWTRRFPATSAPARSWASAVFVPSHVANGKSIAVDKVVVFGGDPWPNAPYPQALCDLWAWNGTNWEAIYAPEPRPCLVDATAGWDTSLVGNPRLILAGGFHGPDGGQRNSDIWYFTFTSGSGGSWSKASTTDCAPLPSARGAYDGASRKLAFFGGADQQGYAYDDTLVCP
jgi:hypothetical protein